MPPDFASRGSRCRVFISPQELSRFSLLLSDLIKFGYEGLAGSEAWTEACAVLRFQPLSDFMPRGQNQSKAEAPSARLTLRRGPSAGARAHGQQRCVAGLGPEGRGGNGPPGGPGTAFWGREELGSGGGHLGAARAQAGQWTGRPWPPLRYADRLCAPVWPWLGRLLALSRWISMMSVIFPICLTIVIFPASNAALLPSPKGLYPCWRPVFPEASFSQVFVRFQRNASLHPLGNASPLWALPLSRGGFSWARFFTQSGPRAVWSWRPRPLRFLQQEWGSSSPQLHLLLPGPQSSPDPHRVSCGWTWTRTSETPSRRKPLQ